MRRFPLPNVGRVSLDAKHLAIPLPADEVASFINNINKKFRRAA